MSNLKLFLCLVLELSVIFLTWGSIVCIREGYDLIAAFLIVHVLLGATAYYKFLVK